MKLNALPLYSYNTPLPGIAPITTKVQNTAKVVSIKIHVWCVFFQLTMMS